MDEHIDIFHSFLPEVWSGLSNKEREFVLQSIVDEYFKKLGIDKSPRVWICDFPDGNSNLAEHYPKIGQILIRADLVNNGQITIDGDVIDYKWYLQQVYFALMHEMRHSIQKYYVEHPELCGDIGWLELMSNNRNTGTPETSVYFTIDNELHRSLKLSATCLYELQPSEIDANDFAQKQLLLFVQHMRDKFPDHWMYDDVHVPIKFNARVEDARVLFLTNSPVEDINDVLFAINGNHVDRKLNDCVCGAVRDTQANHLYEKLELYLENERNDLEKEMKVQNSNDVEIDISIFLDF